MTRWCFAAVLVVALLGGSSVLAHHSYAGFDKDPLGRVFLQGMLKKSTAVVGGETMFTLPAGYRPAEQTLFTVHSNGAFARIDVMTTGALMMGAGINAAWTSLAGLSFRAV
jgi:hypothetical protein